MVAAQCSLSFELSFSFKHSLRSFHLDLFMGTCYPISTLLNIILNWHILYVGVVAICWPSPVQAMMCAYLLHISDSLNLVLSSVLLHPSSAVLNFPCGIGSVVCGPVDTYFLMYFTMSKQFWKVLNWNIRGLNCADKWLHIRNKISDSGCSTVFFQEIKKELVESVWKQRIHYADAAKRN